MKTTPHPLHPSLSVESKIVTQATIRRKAKKNVDAICAHRLKGPKVAKIWLPADAPLDLIIHESVHAAVAFMWHLRHRRMRITSDPNDLEELLAESVGHIASAIIHDLYSHSRKLRPSSKRH